VPALVPVSAGSACDPGAWESYRGTYWSLGAGVSGAAGAADAGGKEV